MTSIHAIKPKPKTKVVGIGESTTVNAGSGDTITSHPLPSIVNTISQKDQISLEGITNGGSNNSAVPLLGKKFEGELSSSAKLPVDKKKMEARKKSLKRL